jgi:hypothetical protein
MFFLPPTAAKKGEKEVFGDTPNPGRGATPSALPPQNKDFSKL